MRLFSLLWIGIALLAGLLFFRSFRLRFFSAPLFSWFRSILPSMSETERIAIEAGKVGWEKLLFQGRPDWEVFDKLSTPQLSTQEQLFLENQIEAFCALLNDWEIVHERLDLPIEAWNFIKKEKLFGIIIPKEFGGLGFSALAHSEMITKIATKSISAAVTIMVPNSLGPAELLLHYGTPDQKKVYLPRLAAGEEIPCFALTSLEAGSDASAMVDQAIVCRGNFEGESIIGIRLSFEKRYITLAPVATLIGVAFKLYDPEGLIGNEQNIGITLALIPASHPGVERGERHFPLNLAFMNGPVRAKNIFIPLDWIIGGREKAGKGWQMLMECLSAGRGISLPALSTATGVLACRMSSAYTSIREQFKMPLVSFEGIEESLSRIIGNTYLLQAARLFTISSIQAYHRPSVATAIAKYHMTELSRQIINDAMDIHGGRGIMLGPKNYLGRGYQAMPICITVEGANILTRNLMIFGQGAIRCHPFAKAEIEAAQDYSKNPRQACEAFDKLLISHIIYFISNFFRCIILSLTRGRFVKVEKKDVTNQYIAKAVPEVHTLVRRKFICEGYKKKISWLSVGLAVTADLALMMMGGSLKRRERLSARLGDVLSQLYLASAVIKYYSHEGKTEDEVALHWALQTCFYRAQEAFYGFFNNVHSIILGPFLKRIIFPFGKVFSLPSDTLSQKLVYIIIASADFRSRLTSLCYIGDQANDPTGIIERTFSKLHHIKDIQKKIKQASKNNIIKSDYVREEKIKEALAKNIISETESKELLEYETLRQLAMAVDVFSSTERLRSSAECQSQSI